MAMGVSLMLTAKQVFCVEWFTRMYFIRAVLLSESPYRGSAFVCFDLRMERAVAASSREKKRKIFDERLFSS